MWVDFESLPANARIWIYQATKPFSTHELEQIRTRLEHFVSGWKRHGETLKASFKIAYDQFIILGVDESFNNVSGCSIDASVHIVQELEKEFELVLLDKMKVAFKDGENINTVSFSDFKAFVKTQKIDANTIVFNNLIKAKTDLESNWEVKASTSWHSKFLEVTG